MLAVTLASAWLLTLPHPGPDACTAMGLPRAAGPRAGPGGARKGAWGNLGGTLGLWGKGEPVVSPTRAEGSLSLTGLTATVERRSRAALRAAPCSQAHPSDTKVRTMATRPVGPLYGACGASVLISQSHQGGHDGRSRHVHNGLVDGGYVCSVTAKRATTLSRNDEA